MVILARGQRAWPAAQARRFRVCQTYSFEASESAQSDGPGAAARLSQRLRAARGACLPPCLGHPAMAVNFRVKARPVLAGRESGASRQVPPLAGAVSRRRRAAFSSVLQI